MSNNHARALEDVPKRRWWTLDPAGAICGLLFTALSITPSLLPRPALFQGAIAAVAFGLGYLFGVLCRTLIRIGMGRRTRAWSSRRRRVLWAGYALLWIAACLVLGSLAVSWQNEIRILVEMPPLIGADFAAFFGAFVPTVIVMLAVGKGVRRLFCALRTRSGTWVALFGAASILTAGIALVVVGAVAAVDAIYLELNGSADAAIAEPSSEFRSAGPQSAIAWNDLGRHGAAFVAGGPRSDEISALTGVNAQQPIRVYAGLESAESIHERADLVVTELERTGAFDRSILVVATTTGSGWLEPQTMDAVEYLHAGDTAIASLQYAYTPSWVSFLFDPDAPVAAAEILFAAVEERWKELPENRRPELVVYGLSLGAHGGQAIFADLDELRARVDGAMFVGSPAGSAMWQELQRNRDAGSPAWQPVYEEGRQVRWMSQAGDDKKLGGGWEHPRVLYLQHATDPITWLAPELIWKSPEWLRDDQRGTDVSASMRWMPGITAVQVAIDMLGGEAVPARHGHNFGDVVTEGWRSVIGDAGLEDVAVDRIQAEIESYAPIPPYIG